METLLLTPATWLGQKKIPSKWWCSRNAYLVLFSHLPLNTHILSIVKSCGPSVNYLPVALQVHSLPMPTLLLPLQTDLYGSYQQPPCYVQSRVPERGQGRKQSWGVGRGKGEVSNLNILLLPAVLLNQRSLLFSRWPLLNDKPFWLLKTTPSTPPIAAGVVSSPFLRPWRFLLHAIHTTLSKPS